MKTKLAFAAQDALLYYMGMVHGIFLAVIIFFFGLGGNAEAQNASSIVPKSCDAGFYDSLTARATLESQREVTQASIHLFKPDSVLQYSCYDAVFGSNTESIAGQASQAHLSGNFSHSVLGGNGTNPQNPGSSYQDCLIMNEIWTQAQCANFDQTPENTGFFIFEDYANGGEKRQLPTYCNTPMEWKAPMGAAFLPAERVVPDVKPLLESMKDIYKTDCSNTPHVGTGVIYDRPVGRIGVNTRPDEVFICAAPNCWYNMETKLCSDANL